MAAVVPARLRNTLPEGDINVELRDIRTSVEILCDKVEDLERAEVPADEIDFIGGEVHRLLYRVEDLTKDVDDLQTRVYKRFEGLEIELKQSTAWLRNQRLKNPIMPIQPLVVWDTAKGGLNYPDPKLFPKNAKEFYALRTPKRSRHHRMLNYLVSFYDVQLPVAASPADGSSTVSDLEFEGNQADIRDSAHIAVEILEEILGLSEDNFVAFSERAQEWAKRQQQPVAAKRKCASCRKRRATPL